MPNGISPITSTQRPNDPQGERLRVLVCSLCSTMEELPYRSPNEPGPDPYLDEIVDRHNRHRPHGENDAFLFDTFASQWHNPKLRTALLKEIKARKSSADGVLDLDIFEMRDTFAEDAMKCWNQHGRPEWPGQGCPDFCSASKLLGRPTQEGKEFQKANPKLAVATGPFLCWSCPYQSGVTTAKRAEMGFYK